MSRLRCLRILLCALCLTLLAAAPALAHADLESAVPAEGEKLDEAPTQVRLSFSEPVEAAFSPIEVYDSEGDRVDGDDAGLDPNDPGVVVASLQAGLPAGSYTVQWSVTSADGDPVSGEYSFDVSTTSETAPGTTEAGGAEEASGSSGGALTETGGLGSIPIYAGLALCVIVLLGLSLRGRVR